MKNGFYIYFRGVDYFYATEKKNKTDSIVIDFLNKIQNNLNQFGNISAETVTYYKKAMQRATLPSISETQQVKTVFWM